MTSPIIILQHYLVQYRVFRVNYFWVNSPLTSLKERHTRLWHSLLNNFKNKFISGCHIKIKWNSLLEIIISECLRNVFNSKLIEHTSIILHIFFLLNIYTYYLFYWLILYVKILILLILLSLCKNIVFILLNCNNLNKNYLI